MYGRNALDTRRRREYLRHEILRIINQDLNSPHRNAAFLRNLQFLQLSTLARDFNENDYEMLSSLDNNNRFNNEKVQFLISQLPTYTF